MKKRLGKKLSLNRETIRRITDSRLGAPVGGVPTNGNTCADTCGNDTCNIRICTASLDYTLCFC